jgi:molybdopterin-containing oxidoreductase family iron-sulfur binding subunit
MADPKGHTSNDQGYWPSLTELSRSAGLESYLDAEPATGSDLSLADMPRRRFLQLMSASLALAGLAGCRWPEEEIVPFGKRPESYEPGRRVRFATSRELAAVAAGLIVTSFDGRPIKVEGNPDHPASGGAADLHAQAAILELYDPDRSRSPRRRAGAVHRAASWDDAAHLLREQLTAGGGRGLAVLGQATSSPGVRELRERLLRNAPGTAWFEHDPVSTVAHRPVREHLDLSAARVIVDLDADLLKSHPTALANTRAFAARRDPTGDMSRLYVFEPCYSNTGAMADHRVPAMSSEIVGVAATIAAELFLRHQLPAPTRIEGLRRYLDQPVHAEAARAAAEDLLANRGHGLIVAGPRQPDQVHELCRVLNDALGNTDHTVVLEELPAVRRAVQGTDQIAELTAGLQSGRFDRLLILGGNPVYDAPADLDFAGALARVPLSLHLALYPNETGAATTWQLPEAHFLESWGDCRAYDGSLCAVQPLIAPLHGGKTIAEVLSMIVDEEPRSAHQLARDTFARLSATAGARANDDGWRRFLHDGFLAESATRPARSHSRRYQLIDLERTPVPGAHDLELVIGADAKLFDGRFANNAWLQELPDFMTKLTWDNAALLSPALATELGVSHGDLVQLELDGRRVEMPVMLQPGQARHSVSVALGYGRTAAGRVGNGVGRDVYRLRSAAAPWGGTGLRVTPSGGHADLALTQDHHAIDGLGSVERERRVDSLVREGTLEEYRAHPDFAAHRGVHHPPLVSMWQERQSPGHRWAMTIDLNRCIGCNACVVACQAENNIPVVGKEEVARGREMHWLRLDRYFHGEPESPRVAHQPLACMHCELAPCEQVCPVAATVHSEEGLNVMVYNRCVGTRYCSNNCPYKVRRFNYFNLHRDLEAVEKLAFNPDVTVRARGVMEKCTFCVQRIESARITARNEGRAIRDGDIVPACAQTCPAEAIVFGDLNDPDSRLSRMAADSRAYVLLAELNIKPRTAYLARIRHPSPALEPAAGSSHDGHDVTEHGS